MLRPSTHSFPEQEAVSNVSSLGTWYGDSSTFMSRWITLKCQQEAILETNLVYPLRSERSNRSAMVQQREEKMTIECGEEAREEFAFDESYRNLNHGELHKCLFRTSYQSNLFLNEKSLNNAVTILSCLWFYLTSPSPHPL